MVGAAVSPGAAVGMGVGVAFGKRVDVGTACGSNRDGAMPTESIATCRATENDSNDNSPVIPTNNTIPITNNHPGIRINDLLETR